MSINPAAAAGQAETCPIDGSSIDEDGLCIAASCQPADRDRYLAEGFAPFGQGCAHDDTPFDETGRCAAAGHTKADSDAYEAWLDAEEERRNTTCLATYETGGPDPYGAECDLPKDHTRATLPGGEPDREARRHEADDPIAQRVGYRVRWNGGGFCAGDPIPASEVEYIRPEAAR